MKTVAHYTRYLILFPVIGLLITSALFFVLGGFGLLRLLWEAVTGTIHVEGVEVLPVVDILEFVHQFLIGTVLYIVGLGFYQLFIQEVEGLPAWLQVDSTEQLETNLIGVTIVVLAINFLGVVVSPGKVDLLRYGTGIALPIFALAFFVGVRLWHESKEKERRNQP
jgi:uncharacterized membrane protein YqhA